MAVTIAKKIVDHPWPAGMLAMFCSAIPLMGWIGFVLIGLMTLCRGPKAGLWVALCAAIPAIAYGAADLNHLDVVLYNAVGGCFYTWLSAMVLWYARSWTLVLEATLVFALVGVAVIHLIVPDITAWWIQNFHSTLTHLQSRLAEIEDFSDMDVSQMLSVIDDSGIMQQLARMATGTVFAFILIFNLFNLLLARLWQIMAFDSGSRLSRELITLRIGYVGVIAFALTILSAWLGVDLAWDFLPVFVGIFLCTGLSLLHFFANKMKNGAIPLVIFYALMVFFPTYVIPLLLICALLDTLIDLRVRA